MEPNPFLIRNQHTSPGVAGDVSDRLREAKRLRDKTGAGIVDCKEALEETAGDFDNAVEILGSTARRMRKVQRDRRV